MRQGWARGMVAKAIAHPTSALKSNKVDEVEGRPFSLSRFSTSSVRGARVGLLQLLRFAGTGCG